MSLTLRDPRGPGCCQEGQELAHPKRVGRELPGVEGFPRRGTGAGRECGRQRGMGA